MPPHSPGGRAYPGQDKPIRSGAVRPVHDQVIAAKRSFFAVVSGLEKFCHVGLGMLVFVIASCCWAGLCMYDAARTYPTQPVVWSLATLITLLVAVLHVFDQKWAAARVTCGGWVFVSMLGVFVNLSYHSADATAQKLETLNRPSMLAAQAVGFFCVGMGISMQPLAPRTRLISGAAGAVFNMAALAIAYVRLGGPATVAPVLLFRLVSFVTGPLVLQFARRHGGLLYAAVLDFQRLGEQLNELDGELQAQAMAAAAARAPVMQPGLFDTVEAFTRYSGSYDFDRVIGSGSAGSVSLMRDRSTGECVVAKVVPLELLQGKALKRVQHEVHVLTTIQHAHVIGYKTTFITSAPEPSICIVMEYAPGGDLAHLIRAAQRVFWYGGADHCDTILRHASAVAANGIAARLLPSATVREWLVQLASALLHIHSYSVLHRDFGPKNILLSADFTRCKVADFGLSKQMSLASSCVGTPFYMSPELLTHRPYDKSSDVWALGVVAFELLALRRPFLAETRQELERRILATDYALDQVSVMRHVDDDPSTHVTEALVACGHPRGLAELATPRALLHPDREQRLTLEVLLEKLEQGRDSAGMTPPVLPSDVTLQLSPVRTDKTQLSPVPRLLTGYPSPSDVTTSDMAPALHWAQPTNMRQHQAPPKPRRVCSEMEGLSRPAVAAAHKMPTTPGVKTPLPPPPTLSRRARSIADGWTDRMSGP